MGSSRWSKGKLRPAISNSCLRTVASYGMRACLRRLMLSVGRMSPSGPELFVSVGRGRIATGGGSKTAGDVFFLEAGDVF